MSLPPERDGAGVPAGAMEVVAALFFAAVGALALWDSTRIGAGWGSDGPRSGYFPFWIGVILILASLGNLGNAFRARVRARSFASWVQLRLVLTVLVPAIVYVAAISFLGLYVSSAILVAYFMIALGGFPWIISLPSGTAAALITFVVFEIWFLLSLPKGPLEAWAGY